MPLLYHILEYSETSFRTVYTALGNRGCQSLASPCVRLLGTLAIRTSLSAFTIRVKEDSPSLLATVNLGLTGQFAPH